MFDVIPYISSENRMSEHACVHTGGAAEKAPERHQEQRSGWQQRNKETDDGHPQRYGADCEQCGFLEGFGFHIVYCRRDKAIG